MVRNSVGRLRTDEQESTKLFRYGVSIKSPVMKATHKNNHNNTKHRYISKGETFVAGDACHLATVRKKDHNRHMKF